MCQQTLEGEGAMSTKEKLFRNADPLVIWTFCSGLVFGVLLGIAPRIAFAADQTAINWASIGPRDAGGVSGKVNAIAYVKSNPKIMYLAGGWGNTPRESPSQMGIYKTIDGGAHWTTADEGLTNPDGTISSVVNGLWLDQKNPSVVLASTEFGGTFKSSNAGKTWKNVDRSESTRFTLVGKVLYLASRKGVLKSTDDGSTWSVSLPLKDGATTVVTAKGATLAGSMNGDVYQLTNSSWTKLGHPGSGPIHDLAIDPFNTQIVYAAVDDKNAWNQCPYASTDGGSKWTAVNCNAFSIGSQSLVFSNVTPHRLFFGDDGSGAVLYIHADGNPNPTINHGSFGSIDIRYIVPVPGKKKSDDACYVLQDQGLFFAPTCSSGAMNILSPMVNNTLVYDVAVSPNGNNVLAPLQDNGATSSPNGGKTWANGTFSGEGGEAAYHPDNSGYCYIAHPDEGLYVSSNGCASFPNNIGPGFESVTFDPSDSNRLYAVTGESSGDPVVSKSNDKGLSWNATSWKFTNPYQVAVAPSDAKSLVVATGTATTPSKLFYTHDGGATWKQSSGLPTTQIIPPAEMWYPVHRFYAAFDPLDAQTILLADHDPETDNILIFRSTDGGQNFTDIQTFKQPKPQRHWPMLLRPKDDTKVEKDSFYYATRFYGNRVVFNRDAKSNPDVVVTTRFGAFLSTDAGTTWKRIDKTSIAHHFIGAAWSQGHLYLASFGEGIIRSTKPIQP
jgi:photosystem II stability/assembly factor-like uncharacterized protein